MSEQRHALEQGQADRSPAATQTEARSVDRLVVDGRIRDLAMFNLAIDSKLRGRDVVALKVEDVTCRADMLCPFVPNRGDERNREVVSRVGILTACCTSSVPTPP
jgi:integrase